MQREEADRMGQMERGHTAEVQPDCMTEAYTVGISETHIRNNATVFRVWQMIERGELTREEGLYLMVNTLADENQLDKCIKKMDREQKRIAKIKLKSDKKLSNMSI